MVLVAIHAYRLVVLSWCGDFLVFSLLIAQSFVDYRFCSSKLFFFSQYSNIMSHDITASSADELIEKVALFGVHKKASPLKNNYAESFSLHQLGSRLLTQER
jgi:hypothetical protein